MFSHSLFTLFCPGHVTHENFYHITGYTHNLTECIMFIRITDIKGKFWSENFCTEPWITNLKSNKHSVVDYDAAENSIFMVSFYYHSCHKLP
jgi:hypothetical protein